MEYQLMTPIIESQDEFELLLAKYTEHYYSQHPEQSIKNDVFLQTKNLKHSINPYDNHSHNHNNQHNDNHHNNNNNHNNHCHHESTYFDQFINFIESIYGTIANFFGFGCGSNNREINQNINKRINPYEPNTHKYLMYDQLIKHIEKQNINVVDNFTDIDNYVKPIIYNNEL